MTRVILRTAVVLLGNPKSCRYSISVSSMGGGGGIFSGIAHYTAVCICRGLFSFQKSKQIPSSHPSQSRNYFGSILAFHETQERCLTCVQSFQQAKKAMISIIGLKGIVSIFKSFIGKLIPKLLSFPRLEKAGKDWRVWICPGFPALPGFFSGHWMFFFPDAKCERVRWFPHKSVGVSVLEQDCHWHGKPEKLGTLKQTFKS